MLPELLAAHGDEIAADLELPARLLDELGAVPSYYLRYFYAHDEVLREQLDGVPRAQVVAEIEQQLLELYRDPGSSRSPRCWSSAAERSTARPRSGSSRRSSPGDGAVHEVDVRNDGTLAGLAPTTWSRCPPASPGPAPSRLPQSPLAPELLGLVQHVAAYERLAVTRRAVARGRSTSRRRCSRTR